MPRPEIGRCTADPPDLSFVQAGERGTRPTSTDRWNYDQYVFSATTTWTTVNGRACWNGQPLSHWSEVLTDELVTIFDPAEVWLFGSVARGDDTSDSDIDVLVVVDRYDTADVLAWKVRAQRETTVPAPFDVTFSDPDRMATRAEIAGTIERAVRREGRLKYCRG